MKRPRATLLAMGLALLCVAISPAHVGARRESKQVPPSEGDLPAARMDPAPALVTPGCPIGDGLYLEAIAMTLSGPPDRQRSQVIEIFQAIDRARRAYRREALTPVASSVARTRIGDLVDYHTERTRGLIMGEETRTHFCTAAHYYHSALDLSPYAERARTQLAAYGEVFDARCRRDPGRDRLVESPWPR